jgi:hypothetical protein
MSARRTVMSSNPPSAEGKMRELLLLSPGSPILALPGANAVDDALSGFVDSEQFRDALLRRLEATFSLSWRLGDVNK